MLSRFVEEARNGETFVVTERGKPVAMPGPLHRPLRDAAVIDRLTSAGRAVPPLKPLTDVLVDANQPTDLTGVIRKAFVATRSLDGSADPAVSTRFAHIPGDVGGVDELGGVVDVGGVGGAGAVDDIHRGDRW